MGAGLGDGIGRISGIKAIAQSPAAIVARIILVLRSIGGPFPFYNLKLGHWPRN